MLALTENVTEIVKQLAEQVPEFNGLRIATESDGQSLTVSPADHAEQDDQVVEQDGATVYLDTNAAEKLDAMVLDAGVDDAGAVQFGLLAQA